MTSNQQYWDTVYRERDHELVGWYQADPTLSMRLLRDCGVSPDAPIVNVGGGSSALVDRLLDEGHTDLTVLDMSATALAIAQERLGSRSALVTWIEADVTDHHFDRTFQVWHDRAVLHFLIDTASQNRYVERLRSAVPVGGHVIIATFAPDGPEYCSGLPVRRHSRESLSRTLGADFAAVTFENETHRTPGGSPQEFLYGHFQRQSQAT